MRKIVGAKLHGIKVTGADLEYHGSITLDPEQCGLAGIFPLEYVEIWNKNSGARISTYVIFGEPGSRCCILNGAAARTCQRGDEVIIASSAFLDESAIVGIKPRVLTFREDNKIDQILQYSISGSVKSGYSFEITPIQPRKDDSAYGAFRAQSVLIPATD